MPQFERYLGIDYSGAQTPASSLKGLRLYAATPTQPPAEIEPPPSPRKYWTRRGLAEYLAERLAEGQPTLVGIDHGFSLPLVTKLQLRDPDPGSSSFPRPAQPQHGPRTDPRMADGCPGYPQAPRRLGGGPREARASRDRVTKLELRNQGQSIKVDG